MDHARAADRDTADHPGLRSLLSDDFRNTLKDITTVEGTEIVLAVYVRQEDKAVSVADTAGYIYGASWNDTDRDVTETLLNRLEELLGNRWPSRNFRMCLR